MVSANKNQVSRAIIRTISLYMGIQTEHACATALSG